jgi:hypothetical protein
MLVTASNNKAILHNAIIINTLSQYHKNKIPRRTGEGFLFLPAFINTRFSAFNTGNINFTPANIRRITPGFSVSC